jgi:hypothetical protein
MLEKIKEDFQDGESKKDLVETLSNVALSLQEMVAIRLVKF